MKVSKKKKKKKKKNTHNCMSSAMDITHPYTAQTES
jgi:hypothetical protein